MTLTKLSRSLSDLDWAPAVDILETDNELLLKMELPGVDAKAISVNVEGNVLTIKGERHHERELKKETYHRVECSNGRFLRSFSLPNIVDADNVRGNYKDGLLTLTLPKKAAAKSHFVELTAA